MNNQEALTTIEIVESHDLDIFGESVPCLRGKDNFLYTPITKLCNRLNLNLDQTLNELRTNDFLQKGIVLGMTPNTNQKKLLFRIDYIAMWITNMNASHLDHELATEIRLFQRGAATLLHEAFCTGELNQFEQLASQLDKDDLLIKAYKEAIGLVVIVRTRIIENSK